MINIVSAFILGLLLWGRTLAKKNVKLHVRVMWVTIALDTALVLFLTVARDVLGTIVNKMTPLLAIHISMALSTVALYYVAAYWGRQILKGRRNFVEKMRLADRIIVPLRVGTLITSIMMSWA